MTLSEWINNIRWKYFTNNKSGLIFKELTKEFRIVHKMTENKRYNIKPSNIVEDAFYIKDDEKEHSFPTVDDKSNLIMYEKALNEQNNRIKELESENKMLKTTISRNEAYINQIKTIGKWSNTGDVE